MTQQIAVRPAPCTPAERVTRSLLGYGVLAGPLYVGATLIQGLTRSGFDLAHDDASLLSNGGLGWIQVTNLLLTGLMTLAFALGMRRALAGRVGGTWGPVLVGIYGLGLMAAGVLRADPADGYPAGAPAGRSPTLSWHAAGHIAAAGIGFCALVAACSVLARHFGHNGRRGLAAYSLISGLVFLAGFAGVASGSNAGAVVGAFWVAVVVAWTWVAVLAVYLYRAAAPSNVDYI